MTTRLPLPPSPGAVLAWPLEQVLTHALRRLESERPEVFTRLGPAGQAVFLIVPTDLPVAFRLDLPARRIRLVSRIKPGPRDASITAPLRVLIGMMDGSIDADSAFFSRQVRIEGGIGPALALHNALEASEFSLRDLAPFSRGPSAWRGLRSG